MAPLSGAQGAIESDNLRARKRANMERLKKLRSVHFAEKVEMVECPLDMEASTLQQSNCSDMKRPLVRNGSIRRFTTDEVELYFSEDIRPFTISSVDYALQKLKNRDDFLMCGCLEVKKAKVGIPLWRKYWAELYHGILMIRKFTTHKVARKRKLIPVGSCDVTFVDFQLAQIQLDYTYQGTHEKRLLRLSSKNDMFLWWWGMRLASSASVDPRLLHIAASRPALSPFEMLEDCNQVENVLFPKYVRVPRHSVVMHEQSGVTHLILVRHGETENIQFCVADHEKKLTTRGLEQAELTAQYLNDMLQENAAATKNVTLIYGGLQRALETANVFMQQMPWVSMKHPCAFLDDGAPKSVPNIHRPQYRDVMHKMAFEYICRWDPGDKLHPGPLGQLDNYKIVVCHTSFIQFCLAQCYDVEKEIIQLGAPIGHCSLTQIDVRMNDEMTSIFTNKVSHLPLTHQTSE